MANYVENLASSCSGTMISSRDLHYYQYVQSSRSNRHLAHRECARRLTAAPIPGANVSLSGTTLSGTTASNGSVTIPGLTPNTSYTVNIQASGYNYVSTTTTITASGQTMTIPLTPTTVVTTPTTGGCTGALEEGPLLSASDLTNLVSNSMDCSPPIESFFASLGF